MNLFNKILLPVAALFLATACSTESELPLPDDGKGKEPDDPSRREILLTIKNTLTIPGITKTKADDNKPIATELENFISTLDVYVFGSDDENSDNYTFQELFYFREDGATVDKDWATRLNFKQVEDKAQALLRIQKGLYVRIYCIANDTTLMKPDGKRLTFDDFSALEQESSIVAGITVNHVSVKGVPNEKDFLQLRTREILSDDKDSYLRTPLPMTGSYVTPTDLTDFSVSARTQMGFKMVRSVARFDVVNDATKSKFTIRNISMGKGRNSITFFPVKAANDKQITYPFTPFTGKQTADEKTQTGALYSYPCPSEDEAYLILSGTYDANMTEHKEVNYQVPFKQIDEEGNGAFIDIAQNHRYTIWITDADEYHLEAKIAVSDWDDAGNIDDYLPDNVIKNEHISLLSGTNASYDDVACVVNVLKDATSEFVLKVIANSALKAELVPSSVNWIEVNNNYKATGDNEFAFKTVDNIDDLPGSLPDLSIRLSNLASGKSKVVRVVEMPGPTISEGPLIPGNLNKFDPNTHTVTLYNTAGASFILAATGTNEKKVTTTDVPNWLTVTAKDGGDIPKDTFTVTLPAAIANLDDTNNSGTFYFESDQAKTLMKVNLKPIDMSTTAFMNGGNNKNTYDKDQQKISIQAVRGNTFSLTIASPEGIDNALVNWPPDTDKWLTLETGADQTRPDGSHAIVLKGTINMTVAAGESVDIVVSNKINTNDKLTLTVTTASN